LLKITTLLKTRYLYNMGRHKKNSEEKKQSVSIAIKPEILEYYKSLHINLSSLVNKLLEDYKQNGNKSL
jgi:hypothetical protein